ncbi:MAG: AzlC family ABC transporter permease [Aestuariivirga sp.]
MMRSTSSRASALVGSRPSFAANLFQTVFGFLFVQAGAPWWLAILASLFVYAGAAQYMMIPMLAAGLSVGTIAVATLIVNLRHVAAIVRDETGRGLVRLKTRPESLAVSQPFMSLFRNM